VILGCRHARDFDALDVALGIDAEQWRATMAAAIAALDSFPQGAKATVLKEAARFVATRRAKPLTVPRG
jgi:farnesyl diphosphate synthase